MGVAAVDVVVAAGSQGGSTFNCRRKPFGLSRLDSCRSCRSTLEGSEVLSSTVLSQFTITFAFVSDFVSLTISLSLSGKGRLQVQLQLVAGPRHF